MEIRSKISKGLIGLILGITSINCSQDQDHDYDHKVNYDERLKVPFVTKKYLNSIKFRQTDNNLSNKEYINFEEDIATH